MTRRPRVQFNNDLAGQFTNFTCPYCGVLQAALNVTAKLSAVDIAVVQCVNCRDIQINAALIVDGSPTSRERVIRLHPISRQRQASSFNYAPEEVLRAYNEANDLYAIHYGASGAYGRRALELLLDNAGYQAKSLADSIALARKETDQDKRLPKRLLQRLDVIKEIGNFALHVRRDGELSIVEVDEVQVEACLKTVEELITFMFEQPGADLAEAVAVNEQLKAAGKKALALPDGPPEFHVLTMLDDVPDVPPQLAIAAPNGEAK